MTQENVPFVRAPYPEHPNRCTAMTRNGQCVFLALQLSNGDYAATCKMHNGTISQKNLDKEALSNYRLHQWQSRLDEKRDSSAIKSLRDEIGILRIAMEERLNQCREPMDFLLHAGPISDLAVKIEKLVTSCHRLEGSMGLLLDKQVLLQFASEVIDIIGDCLTGQEDIANEIAERILDAVRRERTE